MKSKKIKRDTKIVILSVILLTIISLSFSYSAFFNISSGNVVKEISTGTLNVTASATPVAKNDVFPTEEKLPTEEKAILNFPSKDCATLVITNSGTVDANYVVSLSYDLTNLSSEQIANDLASFDNLIIGIFDDDNKSWLNLNPDETGDPVYNMKVTGFTPTEENVYPILKREITKANITETGTTATVKNLKVYIWLADTTPVSEIGKLVYLKLNVKSTPIEGQEVS